MDEQAQGEAPATAGAAGGTAGGDASRDGTKPKSPWDDPRVPWHGKPRKVDLACWGGIVLSGLFYWAVLPFRASLVGTHPVILEMLNGSTEAIIAAAAFARVGHTSLVLVLLAAIVGLVKFDPLYWWAGRLWGEPVIVLLSGKRNRGLKYMDRVQRWGRWFSWPAVLVSQFLPIPTAIIYVVVGWAGMRLVTFIVLDVIGSLAWAGMLAGLGYALGHRAVVVAQTISHYGLWVTIGLVVAMMFFMVRSQRRLIQQAQSARRAAPADQPPAGQPPATRSATTQSSATQSSATQPAPDRPDGAART